MYKWIILPLTLILAACQPSDSESPPVNLKTLSNIQLDSIIEHYRFDYRNPIFIDSSQIALFPLPLTSQNKRYAKQRQVDWLSNSLYSSSGVSNNWNIIIYNYATGDTKLLTDQKCVILTIATNLENTGTLLSKSILYQIVDTDYNQDNQLDHMDPINLFISNFDGSDLNRLSPENENLSTYVLIPNQDALFIKTERDVNKDFKFDEKDETYWYKVELINDHINVIEIIDLETRKNIKQLFIEQWMKNQ